MLALLFVAFIGLGFPDGLIGVAWPSIRGTFDLSLDALGSLLGPFFASYVAASFASGPLLARMTVGSLLAISCLMTGVALLGYAAAPAWIVMVACAVVAGFGAGAVDVGVNAHVASHHGPRALNWMHAAYGTGAALGPILMTAVLGAGRSWRLGYAIVGVAELTLATAFAASLSLWPRPRGAGRGAASAASIGASLRVPWVWFGVAAFFVYVGLEAVAGVWAYSYLTSVRSMSMTAAGLAVTVFWTNLTIGRVLFGAVAQARTVSSLLRFAMVSLLCGSITLWVSSSAAVDVAALALIGLACGPVFPTLMSLTPSRVGEAHAANAVGFQVAAAATGQSLVPTLVGTWARISGLAVVPLALVISAIALWILYERLHRFSRETSRARAARAAPVAPDAGGP